MKKLIFLGFLISIVSSCSLSHKQDEKRIELVNSLKGIGISFFKDWSYNNRGTADIKAWYKTINDRIIYSCQFLKMNGAEEILITNPKNFLEEQKISIDMNGATTSKAYRFKDKIVFTKLDPKLGQYEQAGIITNQTNEDMFNENNIFNSLENMGKDLDKIGVRE
ncbi:MAG: hypothetical protein V4556_08545 [Bacteroidota bacterium]